MPKPRILILIDYYIPGYKSGGPVRTIANVVEHLGEEFDFRIVTRDHDATETQPYPDIESNIWNQRGYSQVFYASSISFGLIRQVIQDVSPDTVYLNSFFSPFAIRYLIMRRLGLVPHVPVILAPRGEFSPGALRLKRLKKRTYMCLASLVGLYRDLIWQASSEQEKHEIQAGWSKDIAIHVAPDMPPRVLDDADHRTRDKTPGSAHFVFLSRISPKKNITMALRLLGQLEGEIAFSIVGPVRDEKYWRQCREVISTLPRNVKVEYLGAVPHHQVQEVLGKCHFFLLPTMGENFGHAILEAMLAGCPVLISDQTPWHGLANRGVGWNLPLESENDWLRALQSCVSMDYAEFDTMSNNARVFASHWIANSDLRKTNIELFRLASHKE